MTPDLLGGTPELSISEEAPLADAPGQGTPTLICFPSAGLASSIVGHYIIQRLKLPRIAAFRSPFLISASVILDGRPNPPIRVHGNRKVAVVVSEFPPSPSLLTYLARAIIGWLKDKGMAPAYVVEGVLQRQDEEEGGEAGKEAPMTSVPTKDDGVIVAIPATDSAERVLTQLNFPRLDQGVVGGLTGDLLNEAAHEQFNLSVLFARIGEAEIPEYRAAAHLLQALDKLVPDLNVDPEPLLKQAEVLERMLRESMKMSTGSSGAERTPTAQVREPSIYG